MPHLSEGDLHAWLDGALRADSPEGETVREHLARCPECAARLDEARELAIDAREILSAAVPDASRPAFDQIRRRAAAEAPGSAAKREGSVRPRGRWLNVERLSWAATVVLALGAGWIGRSVLEEKGWTDPFHEGPPAAVVQMPEAMAEREASLEQARADERAPDEPVGKAGERGPEAVGANEAKAGERLALRDDARLDEAGAAKRTAPAESMAAPAVLAPAAVGEEEPESPPAAELAAADVLEESPDAPGRQEARARSVHPAVDPWHELPQTGLAAPAAAPGCYRLEYSWAAGLEYVPGTIELRTTESENRQGREIYLVLPVGDAGQELHEAIWAATRPDSLWIRMVTGVERDAFTIRAGLLGQDWSGEGRVLKPGGPVSMGQARGPVRLVRTSCRRQ